MTIKKHTRREVGEWKSTSIESYWASLYIAGNYEAAEMICRRACFPSGLCVTIEKVKYIFGGGSEDGVRVGFIQYPPFPEEIEKIKEKAISLGKQIAEECFQFSFTIVATDGNIFCSRVK